MKTLIRSSASVITGFALGISLQSFSIAGAQNTPNISGYNDTKGNFWVTELKPKEKYTVKNVTRTGQRNTLAPNLTNSCGELRIANGAKYQSIQIVGIPTVIIPKNMPKHEHTRC